ncbi:MAG: DegT/DnrJ/EryC1/StrS family aminotransferase [Nitrospinae bacterium]|nr:DegT/DnrJ/EryC1/StrS family aminotransferase [Nitrospinota bacterium]
MPFFELSRQYSSLSGEINSAIQTTLARGRYILDQEVASFERAFAGYNGAAHAVGVASGTEALQVALLALGIKPGDEVITAPNTATPTVCAIVSAGATPAFVDVDPGTFLMDPAKLEERLANGKGRKAKAVIPVHLYGRPADMEPINTLAAKYGLKVVEDVAQATGAEFLNHKAGAMGDAGCFSFYPTKNLGAYGDGGMIITNDDETARLARMIRNYGEESKFNNVMPGINSRLDEIQAAILNVKLKRLDGWNARRRKLAALYSESLAGLDWITTPADDGRAKSVYHLYVIKTAKRDALAVHLSAHGVHTMIHYPKPCHLQKAFEGLGYSAGSFPVAEKLAGEILSLPIYPELEETDVAYVADTIRSFR